MSKDAWKDVPIGTIVDSDIKKLAQSGELIPNGYDETSIKQACYELSASSIFWDVASQLENKRVDVEDAGYLLRPNCYVVAIVSEEIRLPANVLGRILTKGRLFSTGLLPVNTYADPGFEGRLGITLYNASKRYILIKPGEPIAKIEFVVLPKAVDHPYNGQHGFETEIWPIANHLFADIHSPVISNRIGKDVEELALSFGPRISKIAKELQYYRTHVWIQIFLILATFVALFAVRGYIGLIWSVGVGVVANFITTAGLNLWGSRKIN
jgi:dCTP deaminase